MAPEDAYEAIAGSILLLLGSVESCIIETWDDYLVVFYWQYSALMCCFVNALTKPAAEGSRRAMEARVAAF